MPQRSVMRRARSRRPGRPKAALSLTVALRSDTGEPSKGQQKHHGGNPKNTSNFFCANGKLHITSGNSRSGNISRRHCPKACLRCRKLRQHWQGVSLGRGCWLDRRKEVEVSWAFGETAAIILYSTLRLCAIGYPAFLEQTKARLKVPPIPGPQSRWTAARPSRMVHSAGIS